MGAPRPRSAAVVHISSPAPNPLGKCKLRLELGLCALGGLLMRRSHVMIHRMAMNRSLRGSAHCCLRSQRRRSLYQPDEPTNEAMLSPDGKWLLYRTSPGGRHPADIFAVPVVHNWGRELREKLSAGKK